MSLNGILEERITGFETKREANDRKRRRGRKNEGAQQKTVYGFLSGILWCCLLGWISMPEEWLKKKRREKSVKERRRKRNTYKERMSEGDVRPPRCAAPLSFRFDHVTQHPQHYDSALGTEG